MKTKLTFKEKADLIRAYTDIVENSFNLKSSTSFTMAEILKEKLKGQDYSDLQKWDEFKDFNFKRFFK